VECGEITWHRFKFRILGQKGKAKSIPLCSDCYSKKEIKIGGKVYKIIDFIELNKRFRKAWEEGYEKALPKLARLQSQGWIVEEETLTKEQAKKLMKRLKKKDAI